MKKSFIFGFLLCLSIVLSAGISCSSILACYKEGHGQLRIVSSFDECLYSEVPIALSQSYPSMVGEYQGEICLAMPDYDNAIRFRIGTFFLGDIYYSLSGMQYNEVGGYDALSGSGILVNGHLEMVITIVRSYVNQVSGLSLLASQMAQIRWNETEQGYDLSVIEAKQYVDDPGHEDIGDDYSLLIEVPCL